ncbi:MAG: hypothetical protein LC104_08035 [Bacteroidales bacterium]|nr:hypothetical protein [Bacteroidales bacterium]
MDTYIALSRLSVTRHLFPAIGMGLALASLSSAQEAVTPAARLRVAQPVEAVLPVARGVYPDAPVSGFAPVPAASATFSDRVARLFSTATSTTPAPSSTIPPTTESPSGPFGWGLLPSALAPGDSPAPAGTPMMPTGPARGDSPAPAPTPTTFPVSISRTMNQIQSNIFPPSNSVPPKFDGGWNPFAADPAPAPKGNTPPAATPATPPVAPVPVALPAVMNPTTFATPPAYRWYGWGTTVPGANPYAPAGKSPQGSASWYSQSRATPGAFPDQMAVVPASPNPLSPPVYASQPQPREEQKPFRAATRRSDLIATPPVSSPTSAPAPDPMPSEMSAPPVLRSAPPVSQPAPPVPPASQPAPPVPRPVPPVMMPTPYVVQTQMHASPPPPPETLTAPTSSPQLVPIAVSHSSTPSPSVPASPRGTVLNWKPATPLSTPGKTEQEPTRPLASPLAPPRVEIVSNRSPEPAPLPVRITVSAEQIQRLVAEACADWVQDVEIHLTGSTKIVVRFAAFSESHAHAAAEAVSRIPELKGFEIGFEARVANR